MIPDLIAVVVLYKTRPAHCKTLIAINAALKDSKTRLEVVVYDNSALLDHFPPDSFENLNISYYPDVNNSGVSKAYNYGYAEALKRGKKWILLLDQDTVLPDNALEKYDEAITEFAAEVLFAPVMITADKKIISPCDFKYMRGAYAKDYKLGLNLLEGRSLVNSGLCMRVTAFAGSGGYNDHIKLDYSDHDFIRRFALHVSPTFVLIDLIVPHDLSTDTMNTFESDKHRFSYYLEGSKHFQYSLWSACLLKTNNLYRALKLSLIHKNIYFVRKCINSIFS